MGRQEDLIRPADAVTPPERWRYARHLAALADAAGAAGGRAGAAGITAEADVVAAVLRDPDPIMAESAVVTHLDRRATRLLDDAAFPAWADALALVVADRAFPARRLREWTLLRAIGRGEPWSAEELTAASDWCQRTAAGPLASYEALTLLAGSARTRRVRNAAAQRLRRHTA
ncbi:hypothetical protein HYE82_15130 [Streptomyces sp. BR123]|uniref:hypothetical protein n=1 Tax=Streptomyces sp. BR123 TaxID=2749828 RepID=UPI0015C4968D|nr:hypothetical protein [Streptomyces sp. BR123]NXY95698.1 hypothetical protein [Streptomyces sp. BR123]